MSHSAAPIQGSVLPAPRESSLVCALVTLGCELGLFEALESRGPATAAELAQGTGLDEASVDEWLGAMVEAGRVEHKPDAARYALPSSMWARSPGVAQRPATAAGQQLE